MNDSQKKVVYTGSIILILMLLFPPYAIFINEGMKESAGYSFILSESPKSERYYMLPAAIDIMMLAIQYLFVVTICYVLTITLKDKK